MSKFFRLYFTLKNFPIGYIKKLTLSDLSFRKARQPISILTLLNKNGWFSYSLKWLDPSVLISIAKNANE